MIGWREHECGLLLPEQWRRRRLLPFAPKRFRFSPGSTTSYGCGCGVPCQNCTTTPEYYDVEFDNVADNGCSGGAAACAAFFNGVTWTLPRSPTTPTCQWDNTGSQPTAPCGAGGYSLSLLIGKSGGYHVFTVTTNAGEGVSKVVIFRYTFPTVAAGDDCWLGGAGTWQSATQIYADSGLVCDWTAATCRLRAVA